MSSKEEIVYDLNLSTRMFTIAVSSRSHYGYFEHNLLGEECGGGLWFSPSKELLDYDGVFELPHTVIDALRNAGFTVGREFD